MLSIVAFLVWFPFGKLMHAFLFALSRGATGMRFSHRGRRMNAATTATPAFDRQVHRATRRASTPRCAASCASSASPRRCTWRPACCGICAEARHFYAATGEARYTPVYKLEPFRRAFARGEPFAPLVRGLGLVKKLGIGELQQWQELIYDSCTMCGRCIDGLPGMGIDIAELVKEARHGMFKAGLIPERLALMDRAAQQ